MTSMAKYCELKLSSNRLTAALIGYWFAYPSSETVISFWLASWNENADSQLKSVPTTRFNLGKVMTLISTKLNFEGLQEQIWVKWNYKRGLWQINPPFLKGADIYKGSIDSFVKYNYWLIWYTSSVMSQGSLGVMGLSKSYPISTVAQPIQIGYRLGYLPLATVYSIFIATHCDSP